MIKTSGHKFRRTYFKRVMAESEKCEEYYNGEFKVGECVKITGPYLLHANFIGKVIPPCGLTAENINCISIRLNCSRLCRIPYLPCNIQVISLDEYTLQYFRAKTSCPK